MLLVQVLEPELLPKLQVQVKLEQLLVMVQLKLILQQLKLLVMVQLLEWLNLNNSQINLLKIN
jgi:hypothetical protein